MVQGWKKVLLFVSALCVLAATMTGCTFLAGTAAGKSAEAIEEHIERSEERLDRHIERADDRLNRLFGEE